MATACGRYELASPPESEPSSLLGEVVPPPLVTLSASAGLSWSFGDGDGVAVCVAEESSPLGCGAVSPGWNLLPDVMTSCGVPVGSTGTLGVGDAECVPLTGSLLGVTEKVDAI
jgi:hypothetical protein